MKRREFIHSSSTYLAGLGIASILPYDLSGNKVSAADKVRIGAIGINGMGWADLMSILKDPRAECVALCDIDKNVLDKRVGELAQKNIKVKAENDYRKLLENKDIDAIIIGTPDHWHCNMMAEACAAGKDVYVEKPVGNSIVECSAMVAAQKKYNHLVQMGNQRRSWPNINEAMKLIHDGIIGEVYYAKGWYANNRGPIGKNGESQKNG